MGTFNTVSIYSVQQENTMKLLLVKLLAIWAQEFNPQNCFEDERSFEKWNKHCVEDTIQIFSKLYENQRNYMSAMGITKGLQEQFVESGVVTWNFQCAVFNDPDNFALVGPGWVVPISDSLDTRPRSAACIRTKKSAGSRLFRDTRWTLAPNADLCQFRNSASDCAALMDAALRKTCKCGTGVAIVAKRGAGVYVRNYSKHYRGRKWDIAAFCTGFGC